ncbi:podocin isoform X4 [Sparus aurata]|uniref:podocin isoform X4 n=1 Tax=Sparus aurata TaxID=8175 RepID=UPI0011C14E07|nr:podocin-like isoform X4 [Sparus aurata]
MSKNLTEEKPPAETSARHHPYALYCRMEKSSSVQPSHPLKSRVTPRKEREKGALLPPKSHRQRPPKTGRVPQASSVRLHREKPETSEAKMEQETEVKVKSSTVVDIDSMREVEVKEENLGLLEAEDQEDGLKRKNLGVCEWLLMVFVLALVLLFLPLSIWFCVKVVREHERAVIFRLGHLLRGRPRGPGLLFFLPVLDVCHKVDIRLQMLKVPLHTVVTKDLVRPELSAVCYYQIENVALCSTALSSLTTVLQALVQKVEKKETSSVFLWSYGRVWLQRPRPRDNSRSGEQKQQKGREMPGRGSGLLYVSSTLPWSFRCPQISST